MNEPLLARQIKDALDAGLKVSPEVSARLAVARERALEHHRVPAPEMLFAAGGRTATRLAGPAQRLTRVLLPIALLVAAVVGLHQWQEHQRAARRSSGVRLTHSCMRRWSRACAFGDIFAYRCAMPSHLRLRGGSSSSHSLSIGARMRCWAGVS